ncbi:amphoterin-induced protein 1 [Erpetoichthys calabaricus]|uniref:Adhesion molecule with Ig like domain 1 n=1 Tax=Erpetoichthys calabaricus TaxID=27687 RepID=A0A8C4RDW3_ERPCA|nr:amphoterin-induced protein 1 [Erpetoichthys calabaricus]
MQRSGATSDVLFFLPVRIPPERLLLPSLWVLLSTILLPLSGVKGSTLNFHTTCICASNIVSCSKKELTVVPTGLPSYTAVLDLSYNSITRLRAEWTVNKLEKLKTLLLNHNGMTFISTEAFSNVPNVRYLDLSSNKLHILEECFFQDLQHLEVLLLYDNIIAQIDRSAFEGLNKLQKLYLSRNKVSRFPMELVKEKTRLRELTLLDISSNNIKTLPVHELKMLPAWIKNGLYFHNNPFTCDCELYSLLAHWHIRRLNSAVDFKDEYTCIFQKMTVGVFELSENYLNCSTVKETDIEAYLGDTLTITCDTKNRGMTKMWTTPNNDSVALLGNNHTYVITNDGNLQIRPVRAEDSGIYTCFAVSDTLNETLYVSVKVHNFTQHGGHETLNTAYTTLVGCIASVVLVLIYLYLTPCRCLCCRGDGKSKSQKEDSIHSSMLSATPTHDLLTGKAGLSRHVAFIEPSKNLQGQNGKVNPALVEEQERKREKDQRKKSDAESISSVFSDTPIVV